MDGIKISQTKAEDQKIIFLNSYLPRTGHNFASEVFKVFSDHEVLIHNRSETRISVLLDSYHQIKAQNFYESDRIFLDSLFMEGLRERIMAQSTNKYIMIKDTSFIGANFLPEIFPDDLHFILIRDPKAVFLSLLKGMNLKKNSWKNKIKKLGIPGGFYPYFYSRKISTKVLKNFPDLSAHTVIRYEDLVKKDDKVLTDLKAKFQTKKSLEQIKREIDEIQVINSSFFEETKGEKIWDMKPKTKEFDPLGRRGQNKLVHKAVEFGSRKLRKKLKYI